MGWNEWIGKKIFLRTRQGKVYNGKVINILEIDETHQLLEIRDKFSLLVAISVNEIIEIKEESNEKERW